MQTIQSQLDSAFRAAIQRAFGEEENPQINVAQNAAFGDYQSNVAMGLAKRLGESTGTKTNPRAVAEKIKAALQLEPLASEVTIAGPGFINIRLSPAWVADQIRALVTDPRLGIEPVQKPGTVVVDYSAPNVAKQMHAGHIRSTIIGDAISRVLAFRGDTVIRQNHIGDWGTQFGMLIAYLRSTDASGNAAIEDLDRFYKEARKQFEADTAFADEARATVVKLQAGGADELRLWKQIVDESRRHFQPIYQQLNVLLTPADERGESFYNPLLAPTVSQLQQKKIATQSQGAVVVFTEGMENPLIIEKTGGGYGYATTDLAAIRYRTETLAADRIIYVVRAPQQQHFKQVFAAAQQAGWGNNLVLEHAFFGSMFGEDGKMFKARSGDSIKLADLLDEAEQRAFRLVTEKSPQLPEAQRHQLARAIGIGALKYGDLSKDRASDYVFSWDRMLAMDGNTAPYLQYAHARIQSIFRKAAERGMTITRPFQATVQLESPFELKLAKQLLRLAEVIEIVARELKPHHLCLYLYELSQLFSGFFENCPVVQSEDPLRSSRLALCEATGQTLALGLDLLGIDHPNEM